jgi:hypothetical protein
MTLKPPSVGIVLTQPTLVVEMASDGLQAASGGGVEHYSVIIAITILPDDEH